MEKKYTIDQIEKWMKAWDSHDIKDAYTLSIEDLTPENIDKANETKDKDQTKIDFETS